MPTHAELDVVNVAKVFDRRHEAGARKTARRVAEQAMKGALTLAPPKDKAARFWSVDLKLEIALDEGAGELRAGCGVLVNIRQGSKKILHAAKAPNRARLKVDASRIDARDVERLVGDAVEAALEQPVAMMERSAAVL